METSKHLLALATILLLVPLSQAYSLNNTYLDLDWGETYSSEWRFMYAPDTWGDSLYKEHFAVYAENWEYAKESDSDFSVDQYFADSNDGRTATLHYEDLSLTRQVYLPPGDAKYFQITYVLSNTNATTALRDVRFFETVDYDIVTSGDSYGWYSESDDSVWQNNDQYFRNGFSGSKQSFNHGLEYWSEEIYSDWDDGELNGNDKFPVDGTGDVAVGMQWNAGDIPPGGSWDITLTFNFGGTAGIIAHAGLDQIVLAGTIVLLDASRSSSVGNIISYEWDLDGDGVYDRSVTDPTYTYEGWRTQGERLVGLRVSDDEGRNATATVRIDVVTLSGQDERWRISLSPDRIETSLGAIDEYRLRITNGQGMGDAFTISASGPGSEWVSMDKSINLSSGQEAEVPLTVTIPEDARPGNYTFAIQVNSTNLGTYRDAEAKLDLASAPLLIDLFPLDSTRTGSNELLVSWRTPVESSGDLFIRAEGEEEFRQITGPVVREHKIVVGDLDRNTLYEYYVRSDANGNETTSDTRQILVDNGISFPQRSYEFTIERDYNQERSITVENTDDEPHELLLNVSNVPSDLAINFVGEGSMDQRIALFPGERKEVRLVFHAQDAQSTNYTILLGLTNLDAEPITDLAYIHLDVHVPVIDFELEEVSEDPHTLAKTIKLTNDGDPITDLRVAASSELKDLLLFQPTLDHAYLGSGESLEFLAVPILTEGFTGARGTITAYVAGEERELPLEFNVPDGMRVFVGEIPRMTIEFDPEYDFDGIANTNPSGGEVVSYTIRSGDSSTTAFLAQVKVKVEQDGKPASKASVLLDLVGAGSNETIRAETDIFGQTGFVISGPLGDYTYRATVEGFESSTEERRFSVDPTPSRTIDHEAIEWQSASDANETFDLAGDDPVTLESPPFKITARIDGLADDAIPILYLRHWGNYSYQEVIGSCEGDEITFDLGYADPGNYTATIATQSSQGIATSREREIRFDWREADISQLNDYTYELPFPVDGGQMAKVTVSNSLEEGEPHKAMRLLYVMPDENLSQYIFTYAIISDRNLTDTLRVDVRDGSGTSLYHKVEEVRFEEYVPLYVDVPVPVYDSDGERIEGFKIKVEMDDYVLFFSDVYELICDPGAFVDGETWKIFWNEGMLTPHNKVGVVIKCYAGFVPGFNTAMGMVDTVNNLCRGDYTTGVRGAGELSLDPILDYSKGNDLRHGMKEWNFIKAVKNLKGEMMVPEFVMIDPNTGKTIIGPATKTAKSFGGQFTTLKGHYLKTFKEGKLAGSLTVLGWASNVYSNYADWTRVSEEQAKAEKGSKAGLKETQTITVKSCINHAPLKNTFTSDLDFLCSPVRNVEKVFVTLRFAREAPDYYQPFDTKVMLNGHLIGSINGTVPQGRYTFEVDPTFVNYAEVGTAENSLVLDVVGMNRGYYVPLEGYSIDFMVKKKDMAVVAHDQEEADRIVANLSGTVEHESDLLVSPEELRISNLQPRIGENVTIEAQVHNQGSVGLGDVQVRFLDGVDLIDDVTIPYIPEFSSVAVDTEWTAGVGSHEIKVVVSSRADDSNPSNNEASKTLIVASDDSDSDPPSISRLQPPTGSTLSYRRPLISADLNDTGSGIDTKSVSVSVDGTDVTTEARIVPARVWYTPADDLAPGEHLVEVRASDRQGNENTSRWTFQISGDLTPPSIEDLQPPDGSTLVYERPLVSASLADAGSGVDPDSVRLMLDGVDVTGNSTVLSTKVWYTPTEPLANGNHDLEVALEDNSGNRNSSTWSFQISAEAAEGGPGETVEAVVDVCPEGDCAYRSIQEAVDAATAGDTIRVSSGTYSENVVIGKGLTLIGVDTGEGRPVVDASFRGSAITLAADGITVEGFAATNAMESGIKVASNDNVIVDNVVDNNLEHGIYLYQASNNTVRDSNANENGFGICLSDLSLNNRIINNSATMNDYGIFLDLTCYDNLIYMNRLVDNRAHNAYDFDTDLLSINRWDNGTLGNYYGQCRDANGDGICDRPFEIPGGLGVDNFPLATWKGPLITAEGGDLARGESGTQQGQTSRWTPADDGSNDGQFDGQGPSTGTMITVVAEDGGPLVDGMIQEIYHTLCTGVQNDQPIEETYEFSSEDPYVISWLNLGQVSSPRLVEWNWISPDGMLYQSQSSLIEPQAGSTDGQVAYSGLGIKGHPPEYMPGVWLVEVYMDGIPIAMDPFVIDNPGFWSDSMWSESMAGWL
ncbi:MAG: right-handed parallel beta-helix repeat-containing protein [Methanotrichaceae archaeon]|nr:right-handed parallel beta-helix repeat-containing protein [Methanotrichaceae archaeon]